MYFMQSSNDFTVCMNEYWWWLEKISGVNPPGMGGTPFDDQLVQSLIYRVCGIVGNCRYGLHCCSADMRLPLYFFFSWRFDMKVLGSPGTFIWFWLLPSLRINASSASCSFSWSLKFWCGALILRFPWTNSPIEYCFWHASVGHSRNMPWLVKHEHRFDTLQLSSF